jgi:hypothetical protein
MSLGRFLCKSSVERLYRQLYSSGHSPKGQLDGVMRRQFVDRATASALAAGPLSSFASSLLSPFYINYKQGKAILWRGEKPAWIVDTAEFTGTPTLDVHRTPQKAVLTLHGTSLAADLSAFIGRYPTSNIRIEFAGLNLVFEGPPLPRIDGESDLTPRPWHRLFRTSRSVRLSCFRSVKLQLVRTGNSGSRRPESQSTVPTPCIRLIPLRFRFRGKDKEISGHQSAAFSIRNGPWQ